MSTIVRLVACVWILVCITGCHASLKVLTAGHVGCPSDEIETSDEVEEFGSRRWTATCRGQTYYCSVTLTGVGVGSTPQGGYFSSSSSSISCAPEAGSAPPAAPGEAASKGRQPPTGIAGFAFNTNADAAEKACTSAGFTWKTLPHDTFSCDGTPTDIGFPATVSGKLCDGNICAIILHASQDGILWSVLAERFATLHKALTAKYGKAAAQDTKALDDCSEGVKSCFEKGRGETHASWRWPSGHSIDLSLTGSGIGDRPALTIGYHRPLDDAPKSTPKPDAL